MKFWAILVKRCKKCLLYHKLIYIWCSHYFLCLINLPELSHKSIGTFCCLLPIKVLDLLLSIHGLASRCKLKFLILTLIGKKLLTESEVDAGLCWSPEGRFGLVSVLSPLSITRNYALFRWLWTLEDNIGVFGNQALIWNQKGFVMCWRVLSDYNPV